VCNLTVLRPSHKSNAFASVKSDAVFLTNNGYSVRIRAEFHDTQSLKHLILAPQIIDSTIWQRPGATHVIHFDLFQTSPIVAKTVPSQRPRA
jgi:hypothetical protein